MIKENISKILNISEKNICISGELDDTNRTNNYIYRVNYIINNLEEEKLKNLHYIIDYNTLDNYTEIYIDNAYLSKQHKESIIQAQEYRLNNMTQNEKIKMENKEKEMRIMKKRIEYQAIEDNKKSIFFKKRISVILGINEINIIIKYHHVIIINYLISSLDKIKLEELEYNIIYNYDLNYTEIYLNSKYKNYEKERNENEMKIINHKLNKLNKFIKYYLIKHNNNINIFIYLIIILIIITNRV